jgi:hypothetical protein
LNTLLRTLRDKDNEHILNTGIRRFFVVDGYEEVAESISRWRRVSDAAQHCLYTGDFSTMYTTIPHDDLMLRISHCIEEAWGWKAGKLGCDLDSLCLRVSGDNSEWVQRRGRSKEHFSDSTIVIQRRTLEVLVNFLVRNSFVENGGVLRRQVVGIPMGTNCAPLLANLYLYAYESRFIDRLVEVFGEGYARSFTNWFRYIDDVLCVDIPSMQDHIHVPAESKIGIGIYPSALRLNDTNVTPKEVVFLGMLLKDSEGKITVDVFDKRKEFPFPVVRYPNLDSLIPANIPYGVFVGQLYRYYRICTNWRDFCDHAVSLALTLIIQGSVRSKLLGKFGSFLARFNTLRWNVSSVLLMGKFKRDLAS